MYFPVFSLFLVFVIWLTVKLKSSYKQENKTKEAFLNNEVLANQTRKQPLDNLDYIEIPLEQLPFAASDDPIIQECQETIRQLANKKIVNLTGLSNTELKMQYGAANLEALSEYDSNFTLLARSLYKWGGALEKQNLMEEAQTILEFGVKCRTDISGHYSLLAHLYVNTNQKQKINALIETAEQLNTLMKKSILKNLTALLEEA